MLQRVMRWIPLVTILLILISVVYFRWYEYLSLEMMQKNHQQLQAWTSQHYWQAVIFFIAIYVFVVAVSIPGATVLTMTGGLLFGVVPGIIYVVVSATIGACLIFLAVKTTLGSYLNHYLGRKANVWMARLEKGFQKDAFNYTLFLRLVPLCPFWVVNIVPALLNVHLRAFFLATFLGIIPGAFVYVLVGNGLSHILQTDVVPDLSIIFQPAVLLPILALAFLSLIPVFYKKFKKHHD